MSGRGSLPVGQDLQQSDSPRDANKDDEEHEGFDFDPGHFVGDWNDNIGHCITVSLSGPRKDNFGRRGRRNRRDRRPAERECNSKPSLGFLAELHKPGLPAKVFTIARDRGGNEWTCGNGVLLREESDSETLIWLAGDGRKSCWTRTPPEGPVYFDAPPEENYAEDYSGQWAMDENTGQGMMYFMVPSEMPMQAGEANAADWQNAGDELREATADEEAAAAASEGGEGEAPASQEAKKKDEPLAISHAAEAAAAASANAGGFGTGVWNPKAPLFVPSWEVAGAAEAAGQAQAAPAAAVASPAVSAISSAVAGLEPAARRKGSSASHGSASPLVTALAPPPMRQAGKLASPMLRPKAWASPKVMPADMTPRSGCSGAGTPMLSHRRSWGRTPTPSPKLGPVPSPNLGPIYGALVAKSSSAAVPARVPQQPAAPAKPPIEMLLASGETPSVTVSGPRLEWRLYDNWGKLSKLEKDFCMTSPMFGVQRAANMQLAFYPNGSRTAEANHCTVSLTRGPESAGIKFEVLVNGRGIGPKACVGRRYLGDYPKPFDDSEDHHEQTVVVTMQVLEVLP